MSESFGDLVSRMHQLVMEHMKWSAEKTNLWFRTENPNFGGCTPDDLMLQRPAKFEKALKNMIEENYREQQARRRGGA